MAIKDDARTLSTTPELIASGGSAVNRKTVMIRDASATVYVGGPLVDATNGFPINASEIFSLELGPGDDLYAVASAGTPTIRTIVTLSDSRVGAGD